MCLGAQQEDEVIRPTATRWLIVLHIRDAGRTSWKIGKVLKAMESIWLSRSSSEKKHLGHHVKGGGEQVVYKYQLSNSNLYSAPGMAK